MTHAVLAIFIICGAPAPATDGERCEDGTLLARSCAAAEAWLRAGLRPGAALHFIRCEAV